MNKRANKQTTPSQTNATTNSTTNNTASTNPRLRFRKRAMMGIGFFWLSMLIWQNILELKMVIAGLNAN